MHTNLRARQHLAATVVAPLLFFLLTGCGEPAAKSTDPPDPVDLVAQYPYVRSELPLIAKWLEDTGMSGTLEEPSLYFAIWDSGLFVRRRFRTNRLSELSVGILPKVEMSSIRDHLAKSGVFDLSRKEYLVFDAPETWMLATHYSKRALLHWDEVDKPNYGIGIDPDAESKAFIDAWRSLDSQIERTDSAPFVPCYLDFGALRYSWLQIVEK